MRVIEKIALVLFSYIALILSFILCLLVFGWLDINFMTQLLKEAINNVTISTTILVVSVIIILLAIRCIFFDPSGKEAARKKEGILLENNEGKLLITRDTLESLIASVAKGFNGAENVSSKVFVDEENNLSVFVTLYVHPNAIIKDLSSNLQIKIRDAIKKTSDLEVKEVNIKVKNIATENKVNEG